MAALSGLGIALTVIFVLFATALIAQFIFVKWRQRQFRRRTLSTVDRDCESISSAATAADAVPAMYLPSKELLYFFCWTNQHRVEPDVPDVKTRPGRMEPEEIDDILKWHGAAMCGPPRFLFTISEDKEREVEAEHDGENGGATAPPVDEMMKRVSLKEYLEDPQHLPVAEDTDTDSESETESESEQELEPEPELESESESEPHEDRGSPVNVHPVPQETTPFSTPCASPPYYTPTPSPGRDHHMAIDVEDTADSAVIMRRALPGD